MEINDEINPYILLTPGPLSTSPSVRAAMRFDSCTWDNDYKSIVSDIRHRLLTIANCDPGRYTTVLMQGSGTFGVESVLGSCIDRQHHCVLILSNGMYGKRMIEMAKVLQLPHEVYEVAEDKSFDVRVVHTILEQQPITHIAMVHCETTTGMLNDLTKVSKLAQQHQLCFIVDAMSSFGGIEFDITTLGIDFLISSANKCIQGVPGFSFVIADRNKLTQLCQDKAKSLSLDLYGQWYEMEKHPGKWRYTSPTHVVLAFHQALKELVQEGGVKKRAQRYHTNQTRLQEGMQTLGFETYIPSHLQSSIITTFLQPDIIPKSQKPFDFAHFYQYLKSRGFVIYPGKVTNKKTFRIGTIGHLFLKDVEVFLTHVHAFVATA